MPFQPGQSGNPNGRPSTRRTELNELLEQVFTNPRRKKVLEKLIDDAEKGNHEARTLLLAYAYGKPVERKEVTGEDGAPIAVQFVEALNTAYADDPDTADS